MSEETLALREDVYDVLPFILTVANETFESQKLAKLQTLPGRGSTDFSNFTEETMLQRQGWCNKNLEYLNFKIRGSQPFS